MTTLFGREVRLLVCPQCGAPVEGARTGPLRCAYCHASIVVTQRDDPIEVRHASHQDQWRWRPWPTSVQRYVLRGKLDPAFGEQVGRRWYEVHRACLEVESPPRELQDELFALTRLIEPTIRAGARQVRAMLESALEGVNVPGYRQELCGHLVRNAVRAGDQAAALAWLGRMDARSDDLRAGSAFRVACAFVRAAEGDAPGVLAAVGEESEAVAFVEEDEAAACAFRSHALEQLQRPEEARRQLLAFSTSINPRTGHARKVELYAFVQDDAPFPLASATWSSLGFDPKRAPMPSVAHVQPTHLPWPTHYPAIHWAQWDSHWAQWDSRMPPWKGAAIGLACGLFLAVMIAGPGVMIPGMWEWVAAEACARAGYDGERFSRTTSQRPDGATEHHFQCYVAGSRTPEEISLYPSLILLERVGLPLVVGLMGVGAATAWYRRRRPLGT